MFKNNLSFLSFFKLDLALIPFLSSLPSLPNSNIKNLFWVNFHGVLFQNHKICKFAFSQRSYNIIHMTLPSGIYGNSLDCLIWRNCLVLIQDLFVLFHYASHSILNATKRIDWLAIVIAMDTGDQTTFDGRSHWVN
jgi:hypothetical protein